MVATRGLVPAGETLNQHYILRKQPSDRTQVSIHWKLFNLSNFFTTIKNPLIADTHHRRSTVLVPVLLTYTVELSAATK